MSWRERLARKRSNRTVSVPLPAYRVVFLLVAASVAAGCSTEPEPQATTVPASAAPPTAESIPAAAPTDVAALPTEAPAIAPAEPPDQTSRSVAITSPADGATVTSPVAVCVAVSGVDIESGGGDTGLLPGLGHIVVMVDPTSQELRRVGAPDAPIVPAGPNYIHFPDGSSCHDLELSPGRHILLGLVVDSAGTPMNPQGMGRMGLTVE